jgi:hypothetical protein
VVDATPAPDGWAGPSQKEATDSSPAASSGDASVVDDASSAGGGDVDAACSAAVVQIYWGSDNIRCKYDATWTCGTAKFHVYGATGRSGCDPLTDSDRGFRGTCESAIGTTTFDHSDPGGCSCADPAGLAALAANVCGFPVP